MRKFPDEAWNIACHENDVTTLKEMISEGYDAGKYISQGGGWSGLHQALEYRNVEAASTIISALRTQCENDPDKFIELVTNTFYDHYSCVELSQKLRDDSLSSLGYQDGVDRVQKLRDALKCDILLHDALNEAYTRKNVLIKQELDRLHGSMRGATLKYVTVLETENAALDLANQNLTNDLKEAGERSTAEIKRLQKVVAERDPVQRTFVNNALADMKRAHELFDPDNRHKPNRRDR